MSVDKNGLSVGAADETLSDDVQTVDGHGLAGQHVRRLQAAFARISAEPGAAEGAVPASGGQRAVGDHTAVPAACQQFKQSNVHPQLQIFSELHQILSKMQSLHSRIEIIVPVFVSASLALNSKLL